MRMSLNGLLLGCLLWSATVLGQMPPPGGGFGRGMQEPPKIGIISGLVLEDTTTVPIPFAAIAAVKLPDSSTVGGVLADDKGKFKIEQLPPGNYILRVSSVGFKTRNLPVGAINNERFHINGVNVRLKSSTTRLKAVDVVAESPEYLNSIDKKVYSIDKNIVNTGGTVTDVLQQIPSVSVDIDGKVALRGSENVTILVDGKPSGMLGNDKRAVLQQIPAGAVDQIEVITNPSAKYDAEGMAGIINIKTKKDKFQGTNGTVNGGVGTNEKYNAGFSANDRTAHRNIFANYNYRHERRMSYGESEQTNFRPIDGVSEYDNNSHGNNTNNSQNVRAGIDLYLTPASTLSFASGTSIRKEERLDFVSYSFYDSSGFLFPDLSEHPSFSKNNVSHEDNSNFDGSVDFKHTWMKNKGELTASTAYSKNTRNEQADLGNDLFDTLDYPYEQSRNHSVFQSLVAQADLSWPFKRAGKLESGIKSTLRQVDNEQSMSIFQDATLTYLDAPVFGDVFGFDEQVVAGYSMYSGKWRKFEYNGGLRAEETIIAIDSKQAGRYDTNYLSLFPSAFMKYNLPANQEVQLSYTRRINRADSRQLNPFTDYSDSVNIRRGNPYLRPEMIHSLDLSYSRNLKGGSTLTASIYYRHTDDLISRFRKVDTLTGISVMTSINFSSSENIGAEAILRLQLGRNLSVMTSFNYFRNTINASNLSADLQSESNQWNGRMNINAKLTPGTSLQVTGNYMSPMKNPFGEFRGMSGVDAGIRQDLWKGKGSLSLNVTDMFKTRIMKGHNFTVNVFDSQFERYRESRIGMLTLSYRFGKMDNTQRRRSRQDQRPSEMMEMNMDY